MRARRYIRGAQFVGVALVLGVLAILARQVLAEFSLRNLTLGYCAALVAVSAVTLALRGLVQMAVAAIYGKRLGLLEAASLSSASSVLSEILPLSAGTLLKPGYLNAAHGIGIEASAVMLALVAIVYTIASATIGLTALYVSGHILTPPGWLLLAALVAMGACIALPTQWMHASRFQALHRLGIAWRTALGRPRELSSILLLSLALATADAIRFWAAFALLNENLPILSAIAAASLATVSAWVAILPGGLGVVEGTVGVASIWLSYDPMVGVVASLATRLAMIVIMALPAILFLWIYAPRMTGSTGKASIGPA